MKQKNPFLLVSRLCLLTAVPTRWTLNVLQATPRSRYRQEVQHPATSRGLCATPDVHVLEARGGARPGIKVPWTGKCSSGHTGLAEFLCEDKTPSTPETWRQKSSDKEQNKATETLTAAMVMEMFRLEELLARCSHPTTTASPEVGTGTWGGFGAAQTTAGRGVGK